MEPGLTNRERERVIVGVAKIGKITISIIWIPHNYFLHHNALVSHIFSHFSATKHNYNYNDILLA